MGLRVALWDTAKFLYEFKQIGFEIKQNLNKILYKCKSNLNTILYEIKQT